MEGWGKKKKKRQVGQEQRISWNKVQDTKELKTIKLSNQRENKILHLPIFIVKRPHHKLK